MSDLRDRIADALYQHDPTSRTEGMSAHVRQLAREAADARADVVLAVVEPEIAKRDERIAALEAQAIDLEQRASYLATEAIRLASGGGTQATDGSTSE